jgi:deazaflavin-dependent oxidoreductase (nitroreductase family)
LGRVPGVRDGTVKLLSAVHAAVYRTTAGRIGRRLADNDMCLLTTTGRRSGTTHTVPLLYVSDNERFVVIASHGGRPHHPDWYHNLLADPDATLQIMGRSFPVTARTADPAERAVWWPRVVEAYDDYAAYQARTDRQIPVVFLDPGNREPTA